MGLDRQPPRGSERGRPGVREPDEETVMPPGVGEATGLEASPGVRPWAPFCPVLPTLPAQNGPGIPIC